jgi:hypothetical protein
MTKETLAAIDEDMAADRSTAIQPLIEMLDYAMIGGAELKLPKFVFLLRVASEELTNSLEQEVDEDDIVEADVAEADGAASTARAVGGDP